MMSFWNKQKTNLETPKELSSEDQKRFEFVNTQTLSKESLTADKNKDGIPDYLQRQNYASIVNSNKDFMKWESDVEQEIEQYVMGLRGYSFSVTNNSWIPVSPAMMNESGISFIKTQIRTIVNKHSINTNLKGDEVHELCMYHSEATIKTLKYRKNVYMIHLADLNAIVIGLDTLCYLILCRSVDDKQRIHNDARMNMNYKGETTERM